MTNSTKENEGGFLILFFSLVLAFVLFFFFFLKKKESKKFEKSQPIKELKSLNSRQKRILEVLSNQGQVTTDELMSVVKGVTERTLRRDMKKLEEMGLSRKEGNTKGSKYIYTS